MTNKDELSPSRHSPSRDSLEDLSARLNGPVYSSTSRPRAALLIEGGHMDVGLKKTGNPPMRAVVAAIQDAYNVDLVRREWHQGTEDGQLNSFHRSISHVEGGHVIPYIRRMKDQSGRASGQSAGAAGGRATIRVETGVDVAMAMAMTDVDDKQCDPYSVVIVVTGDGDLESAFARAARHRRVYVCSLKEALSAELNRYVKSERGRALYLDDVLRVAAASAPQGGPTGAGGAGAEAKPRRTGAGGRGADKAVGGRTKCFAGRHCNKTGDAAHMEKFRHPCPDYGSCHWLTGKDGPERAEHFARFGHPCRFHPCKIQKEAHRQQFEHAYTPEEARPRPDCPDGKKCRFIFYKNPKSTERTEHMEAFRHPCPFGRNCVARSDLEWSWEHALAFSHLEGSPEGAAPGSPSASSPGPSPHAHSEAEVGAEPHEEPLPCSEELIRQMSGCRTPPSPSPPASPRSMDDDDDVVDGEDIVVRPGAMLRAALARLDAP
jgi:hypothetical protein